LADIVRNLLVEHSISDDISTKAYYLEIEGT